jgi:hypothetical protein
VFWFSLQHFFLSERASETCSWTCIGLHVKYPLCLSDFNKTWIFSIDFGKTLTKSNFIKKLSGGSPVFLCGRTDRQADRQTERQTHRHDEINSRFLYSRFRASWFCINKIQLDVTVRRCLFTAKLLYMFRVSIAPIIRSTSNCNCSFWNRSYHVSEQQPSPSVA